MRERPVSGRVSDAGRARAIEPVRGRRPKASDERTRGKAASAWRAMGIWRRSGCCRGGFCEDRRAPRTADDSGELAAAALDGL